MLHWTARMQFHCIHAMTIKVYSILFYFVVTALTCNGLMLFSVCLVNQPSKLKKTLRLKLHRTNLTGAAWKSYDHIQTKLS